MNPFISATSSHSTSDDIVILTSRGDLSWCDKYLSAGEVDYVKRLSAAELTTHIDFIQPERILTVQFLKDVSNENKIREHSRKEAAEVLDTVRRNGIKKLTIIDESKRNVALSYAEGMALGNYQFLKY